MVKKKRTRSSSSKKSSKPNRKSWETDLPPILPVEVVDVDDDGGLICVSSSAESAKGASQHDRQKRGQKQDTKKPDRAATKTIKIFITKAEADKQKPPPGIGERLLVQARKQSEFHYNGSIIRKIQSQREQFLTVIEIDKRETIMAFPIDRRNRNQYVISKKDSKDAVDGDLAWVEPQNRRGNGPRGARIASIAGNMNAPGAYSLIALANYEIPIDFPDEVLAEAQQVVAPTMEGRTDLTQSGLLTIDPADAKDHDDAVTAIYDDDPDNKGGFRVTVAIADVSWFVRPGNALDKEALKRGNSVYLPDRVVPMLPEHLSNGLCSLREDEDRPCLAVELVLDKNGHLKHHRFMRAMMRSAAKLSYEQAQEIIEGRPPSGKTNHTDAVRDNISTSVKILYEAYNARLIERKKRAPLDLELSERKIILGKDGLVKDVILRDRFDAHKLIEEFMILANVAAAQTLESAKCPLIYRVHDTPDMEKIQSARTYLQTMDYSLVKGNAVRPSHFNQILKIAQTRDEKEMISEVILRTQRQAIYATDNVGHFGLNLTRYAHFTSPIRRYADLIVHRALVKACKLGDGGQPPKEAQSLESIAKDISDLERRAMKAERDTKDRYLADFLSDRTGAVFDARIRGVTKAGLFVMLDITGADGFIPMRIIPGRGWDHVEKLNRIVDRHSGKYYQLGHAVEVRLKEASPVEGGLIFEMISKPQKADKNTPGSEQTAPRHSPPKNRFSPKPKNKNSDKNKDKKPKRGKKSNSKYKGKSQF